MIPGGKVYTFFFWDGIREIYTGARAGVFSGFGFVALSRRDAAALLLSARRDGARLLSICEA